MSRKITFLIGSLLGSALGLLFAQEKGKDLRTRILKAKTPREKFELMFQEYMRLGKDACKVVENSDAAAEIVKVGKDVVKEMKGRLDKDGGRAVKIAYEKANELVKEIERRMNPIMETAAKTAMKKTAAKKAAVKKVVTKAKTAVKDTAAKAKKAVKKATKK